MSFAALVAKDLRVEARGRDALAATATVALLVALAANVAYEGRVEASRAVPGALWTALVFAAQVGLARTFVVERERGTHEGLLASPAGPVAMFASKLCVNLLVLALIAVVAAFALGLFFRLDAGAFPVEVVPVVALGALGVGLATTLNAAVALHGRHWVLLVPLLSLPLLYPVLAAGVSATDLLFAGAPFSAALPAVRVLMAYDVIFATVAWLVAPFLLEP